MTDCGHLLEAVFVCGGLAHNSLYIDALADVTGMLGDGADEFFHLCLFVFFFFVQIP